MSSFQTGVGVVPEDNIAIHNDKQCVKGKGKSKAKVKVHTLDIAPLRSESPPQKR